MTIRTSFCWALLVGFLGAAGCHEGVSVTSSTVDPSALPADGVRSKTSAEKSASQRNGADAEGSTPLPVIDDRLSLLIEFDSLNTSDTVSFDIPVRVVLTNNSKQPIRIIHPDHPKGFDRLSFRLTNLRSGEKFVVARVAAPVPTSVETVDAETSVVDRFPETIEIGLQESVTFDATFGSSREHDLEWKGLPAPNSNDRFSMSAHLQSSALANETRARVWTGHVSSPVVTVRFVAPGLKLPHDYLAHGFPDRAIEIIQADPDLIAERNDLGQTPLHVAVWKGQVDAVRWLLEHAADVNAVDRNGETPLHQVESAEIAARILLRKPDLTIQDLAFGLTPLQRVATKIVESDQHGRSETRRQIVALLINSGAPVDLLTAIHLDDLPRVKAILTKTPAEAHAFQKQNPLRIAASLGRLEICRYLIDSFPVDLNDWENGHGFPTIKEALAYPLVVQLLIDKGADLVTRINWKSGSDQPVAVMCDDASVLHYAARDGAPLTITALLDAGVDLFARASSFVGTPQQPTALEVAAYYGRADNCLAMVRHPQFVMAAENVRHSLLDESLKIAAPAFWLTRGAHRTDVFKVMLNEGANPNLESDRSTVMQIAARQIRAGHDLQNDEILKSIAALQEHGAEVDLITAVAIGDLDQVLLILSESPQSASILSDDGYPALHFAVEMNHSTIVSALLKAGCDVDLRNQSRLGLKNGTALHLAASRGRNRISRLLIDAGADIEARMDDGSTPLHHAAGNARVRTVGLLLDRGANADAVDENDKTPLDWFHDHSKNVPEMERVFRNRK